jgi:hypothetical protein
MPRARVRSEWLRPHCASEKESASGGRIRIVQSRHLVDQVQDESIRRGCPDSANAVMGRETAEAERLGTLSLVPGMPTEICLATEKQTALAYMAKPVMDQVERALREE